MYVGGTEGGSGVYLHHVQLPHSSQLVLPLLSIDDSPPSSFPLSLAYPCYVFSSEHSIVVQNLSDHDPTMLDENDHRRRFFPIGYRSPRLLDERLGLGQQSMLHEVSHHPDGVVGLVTWVERG